MDVALSSREVTHGKLDLLGIPGDHIDQFQCGQRRREKPEPHPSAHDLAYGVEAQHAARLAIYVSLEGQVAAGLGGGICEI